MYENPSQRPRQADPISISCRFVATDQWLRTHIDPSWTVFELKRHLLARCVGGVQRATGVMGSGPRLLVPSPQGLLTLAGLVRPPHITTIKSGGRPSTDPHVAGEDGTRRKPRLSVKVVPGLAKPTPRTVTIHPPTPGMFGAPAMAATGPQPPPPIYFSPRNPISSPELSPPHFVPVSPFDDEPSPSSPSLQLDTISTSSRSTVGLNYSQPQSHTTSPTFSAGASPPSRPFSPSALPQPPESQPLFTGSSDQSILFTEFTATTPSATPLQAQSTPPLVRAMSTPPSPYSPKPPTPSTSRPSFPPQQVASLPATSPPVTSSAASARSPPPSSFLTSRYEPPKLDTASQIYRSDTNMDSVLESRSSDVGQSPLLSAAEFLELESEPDLSYDLAMRSPSPSGPLKSDVYGPSISSASTTSGFPSRSNMGDQDSDAREPVREHRERSNWEGEFRLVSFAMGCVLEEHATVADMRIRPGELLEIQRTNSIVRLAKPTYTQPYFEAPVYVLKRVISTNQGRPQTAHHHHSSVTPRPHQHHIQPLRDYTHPHHRPPPPPSHSESQPSSLNSPMSPIESISSASTRVRSRTVTARDAYDGMTDKWGQDPDGEREGAELELSGLEGVGLGASNSGNGSKAPTWSDSMPTARPSEGVVEKVEWKLRWLTMREGKISISRTREKQGQAQFTRPLAALLSAQQLPAVPQVGSLPHRYISIHFTGTSRGGRDRERDGEIGLRMMDGAVHAHLFRVLLRIINTPGTHSFPLTDTPHISSAPLASQYPEWRQYIVQRAWLAGRGTSLMYGPIVAGPWMRPPWTAWTDKEAQAFTDDTGTSESGDDYDGESGSDDDELYEYEAGVLEGYSQGFRDSDSEIEWDVEGWRAWESESAFGVWNANNSWLQNRVENLGAGRPRSRSLAAPSSRSSSLQTQTSPQQTTHPFHPTYPYSPPHTYHQQYPHHERMLSPVSTSSDVSGTSPNTRRARSSTIAVPSQPETSPVSQSPPTWSPTLAPGARRSLTSSTAGIETVMRTSSSNIADTSSQSAGTVVSRRTSNRTRSTPMQSDRRESTTSLEMQRAMPPSRRAVTSPAPGTKFP